MVSLALGLAIVVYWVLAHRCRHPPASQGGYNLEQRNLVDKQDTLVGSVMCIASLLLILGAVMLFDSGCVCLVRNMIMS